MRLSLSHVKQAVNSELDSELNTCELNSELNTCEHNSELMILGIAIDNRKVKVGDLFICIKGENFDGHNFAELAIQAGAVAVLSQRALAEINKAPIIIVDDTIVALGKLANYWRKQTKAKVVGITGSAGKTTVKEVLTTVISEHGKAVCNALNLNNQIGLPYSILATDGDEDFWVMEVGISKAHDMNELGAILQADIAVILNAADAHCEGLGERGVAYHKASLLNHMAQGGSAFVCADYADLLKETKLISDSVNYFSIKDTSYPYSAKYLGSHLSSDGNLKGKYNICMNNTCFDIETPFRAGYGAENSIAIAAVASKLGLSNAEIIKGFNKAKLAKQRFQVKSVGKWQCINDTYNANPLSMRCMLEAASELANNQPFVCVLGEMGELGSQAAQKHTELGEIIPLHGVKSVFWVGDYATEVLLGLKASNYHGDFYAVNSVADFLCKFKQCKLENGLIFFKGSRSNCLEKYHDAYIAQQEKPCVL